MSRTSVYSALVLRNRPSGESNSEITLLTAEEGIFRATVYGGPKSKLRSHSAPYNSGKVWIYRDPSKDYRKLSDFDVQSWRPGLRELYERTIAAGGIAETVLSTHGGGGDWGIGLDMTVTALNALENASEELCPCLLVHFLWRWSGFLGIQPQIDCCTSCGDRADNSPLWYSSRENIMLCKNCVPFESSVPKTELCPQQRALSPKLSSVPTSGFITLNPGSRKWLATVESIDSSHLYRYSMDKKSFYEAKALATVVLTAALGKKLASWEMI